MWGCFSPPVASLLFERTINNFMTRLTLVMLYWDDKRPDFSNCLSSQGCWNETCFPSLLVHQKPVRKSSSTSTLIGLSVWTIRQTIWHSLFIALLQSPNQMYKKKIPKRPHQHLIYILSWLIFMLTLLCCIKGKCSSANGSEISI